MSYIIFEHKSGSIAITTLVHADVDINDVVQKFRSAYDEGEYPKFMVHAELPSLPANRQFRDAWEKHNGKIVINKEKAKSIHMERIREARDKQLGELDKQQLRHLSDINKLNEIEKQKQELRDIPQNYTEFDVENPSWPAILTKEEV